MAAVGSIHIFKKIGTHSAIKQMSNYSKFGAVTYRMYSLRTQSHLMLCVISQVVLT